MLPYVQLESHQRKIIHEEHEAKDGPNQSSNIREKLINFIKRSFESSFFP